MKETEAFILGIVEGLTEFLPISSTGHMILASHIMGIPQHTFTKTFEIAIQLGAILAVVFYYRKRIISGIEIWYRLIAAFIPTALIGLALHRIIEEKLFKIEVVSIALIVWGIIFILVELRNKRSSRKKELSQINFKEAVLIGIFQSFAMIPGTSRSGATIIGGMLLGLSRKASTEFSFLLAIPTMFAAVGFETIKNISYINTTNWHLLAIGFVTSFIFGFLSVKWLLNFIQNHTFIPFGIYRIAVGIIFFFALK